MVEIIQKLPNKMCIVKCTICNKEYERQHRPVAIKKATGCSSCARDIVHESNKRHKTVMHNDRLARIINNMQQRTQNPKAERYKDYGGRGITLCDDWLNDRTTFYDWALLNGYEDHLSIDRKDNDKGYFPENCRWATDEEQQQNQRLQKDNNTGYRGVGKTYNRFRGRVSKDGKEYSAGTYDTAEEANEAVIALRKQL